MEWQCHSCGELFLTPVWHCVVCDHHWAVDDDECGNCYNPVTTGRMLTYSAILSEDVQAHASAMSDEVLETITEHLMMAISAIGKAQEERESEDGECD